MVAENTVLMRLFGDQQLMFLRSKCRTPAASTVVVYDGTFYPL